MAHLTIEEFGKHLLLTGDLDPIYIVLWNMNLSTPELARWLLAYWCFYHAGVACYMAEQEGTKFWEKMSLAAVNVQSPMGDILRWPRGKERRHFRGKTSLRGVEGLAVRFPLPEDMLLFFHHLSNFNPMKYLDVRKAVKEWYGFGDWISFKVADMLERVVGYKIDFQHSEVFMFDDPYKAALMQWKLKHNAPPESTIDNEPAAIKEVVDDLTQHFAGYLAPPRLDRPVGLQEVETILCKYKSHLHGHYPLMNDIHEITVGLTHWRAHSKLAEEFLGHFKDLAVDAKIKLEKQPA